MKIKSFQIANAKINVFESKTELFQSLYKEQYKNLTSGFCILPGGNTPNSLYKLLSEKDNLKFIISDDRLVNNNHSLSNFNNINNILNFNNKCLISYNDEINTNGLDSLNSKLTQIKTNNTIDLCILGLGEDSHTASLFPHQKMNFKKNNSGFVIKNKNENFKRFTLSYEFILCSKKIIFLVIGKDKSKALHNILLGKKNSIQYPAQEFIHNHKNIEIYCDDSAAFEIIKNKNESNNF